MATIIQIKRSSGTTSPATLKLGELAYTYGTGTQGNLGDRLFIGEGGETDGNANNITVIGGQYFTNQLDHVQGTLTASSALLVDSNKAIDEIFIGNALATGGTLKLNEGTNNGTNFIGLKAPNAVTTSTTFTLPDGDGTSGQALVTDGSGNLSFTTIDSTFTLAADSGSNDTFTTGGTLTFTGGTGIDTTVSDDTITVAIDSNVLTASSTHTLTNKTFDANGTGNSISNIEVADFASGVLDTDLSSVAGTDTTLASAKAIKAYVDSQVTAQDLDFQGDTGGALSIDLDSETLDIAGGTGIDTSGSGNTLTVAIDSTVATLAGTQTFTNKTFDANGTGNSISNIEVADFAGSAIVNVSETLASNDSDTALVTAGAIIDYVDAQDANIASDTLTFTNKTIDANGTGNNITNIDSGNFLSGFFKDEDDLSSDSATSVASQQSIKAYVDAEVGAVSTSSISQSNSNVTVTDSGTGAITVAADGGTIITMNATTVLDASAVTNAIRLPGGTTAQRPSGA